MLLAERRKALIAALVAALVLALPGVALAHEDEAATGTDEKVSAESAETVEAEETESPEPAEVLSTLPVLGSGLNITIGRDEEGGISSIALDPDTATIVKEGDHRVVFLLEDGNTEVVVKSGKGYVQTTVRADATADVTGDGSWSADVFGNGLVTVPYNIAFDGITPIISVGSVIAPDGVAAEVGEVKTKTSDDADKAYSKVKIALASGEETAVVSLKAKVYVNDEGDTKVKVSATLISRDRVKCRNGDGFRRDRDDRDGDRWDGRGHDRGGDRDWGDKDKDHHRGDHDGSGDDDTGGDGGGG